MKHLHGAFKEAPKPERMSERVKVSENRRFWVQRGRALLPGPGAEAGTEAEAGAEAGAGAGGPSFEDTLVWALEYTDMHEGHLLQNLLQVRVCLHVSLSLFPALFPSLSLFHTHTHTHTNPPSSFPLSRS